MIDRVRLTPRVIVNFWLYKTVQWTGYQLTWILFCYTNPWQCKYPANTNLYCLTQWCKRLKMSSPALTRQKRQRSKKQWDNLLQVVTKEFTNLESWSKTIPWKTETNSQISIEETCQTPKYNKIVKNKLTSSQIYRKHRKKANYIKSVLQKKGRRGPWGSSHSKQKGPGHQRKQEVQN